MPRLGDVDRRPLRPWSLPTLQRQDRAALPPGATTPPWPRNRLPAPRPPSIAGSRQSRAPLRAAPYLLRAARRPELAVATGRRSHLPSAPRLWLGRALGPCRSPGRPPLRLPAP